MKRTIQIILLTSLPLAFSCKNYEDAELTKRSSFMRFYSSGSDFIGKVAEVDTDGGFIMAASVLDEGGNDRDALIIKTNSTGEKEWQQVIPNATANAIRVTENGYIIIGEGIEVNVNPNNISELRNTQLQVFRLDKGGAVVQTYLKRQSITINPGPQEETLEIDFRGNAVAMGPNGEVIILGSFKAPGGTEHSYISALDAATFAVRWEKEYNLLDRDYVNCNSLFITSTNRLVWASRAFRQNQSVTRQYVSISYIEPNASFLNNSLYGENDQVNHIASDMQPSPVGYGIVGTRATQEGNEEDIFFARVDQSGNIIESTVTYYDCGELFEAEQTTADEGRAITAVEDGFVLAGQFSSTATLGNGGQDILLIKVDINGNVIWRKLLGGTGDDLIGSIRRTSDGGLLICGTNDIGGLSSILIFKTDGNGEIRN